MQMTYLSDHQRIRSRTCDAYGGTIPFNDWCGLRFVRAAPEDTCLVMPFSHKLADGDGRIAAGAIAALIDAAAGQAALSSLDWRGQVATISLSQSHVGIVPVHSGLIAEGRMVARDGDMMLTDIRIRPESEPEMIVCEARVRMIVVQMVDGPLEQVEYPLVTEPSQSLFRGPDDRIATKYEHRMVASIPSRHHYMGNQMRGALHGGLVAAALYETLSLYAAAEELPFVVLDGHVDFLRPARDLEMLVTAEANQIGSRIGFCNAFLEQAVPGQGKTLIARLSATLTCESYRTKS